MPDPPSLLLVAHGTASPAGLATIARLAAAIGDARPDVSVRLCFLDVAEPRLAPTLASMRGPTVVMPLIVSTGYHTLVDIPSAVGGRADVRITAHLGPDDRLIDVLVDRVAEVQRDSPASVALVAAGSRLPEATAEVRAAAAKLSLRLACPVVALTVGTDLATELDELPAPAVVCCYLLAQGRFLESVRRSVPAEAVVTGPIGIHPALVTLVWSRYAEAAAALG